MSRPLTTLQSVLEGADDAPALLLGSGGGTLTRGQLRRLCCQFAASLRASGVQPGDVVTIAEPNTVRAGLRGGCRRARGGGRCTVPGGKMWAAAPLSLIVGIATASSYGPTTGPFFMHIRVPQTSGGVCGGIPGHRPGPCSGRPAQPKLPPGGQLVLV